MKFYTTSALALLLLSSTAYSETKKSTKWNVQNTSWTKVHEKNYEEFIATLGKAKKNGVCRTTNDCLKSSVANPIYSKLNPSNLGVIYSDCADLPYILRAYFAWMNDLPFAYPIALNQSAPDNAENRALKAEIAALYAQYNKVGFIRKKLLMVKIKKLNRALYGSAGGDIRYNRWGNSIQDKYYVKSGDNINTILLKVSESISTASFRTDGSNGNTGRLFRDTYPVKVDRAAIKPGTVLYDPNGHIAVVYEVTKNGKIHLIDAHPDNSLTAITYGEKFSQTNQYVGGGFSNWRPFTYANGEARAADLSELKDYSLEQFTEYANYTFDGKKVDFYEYVRNQLSDGKLIYNPITELSELMDEICYDFSERKVAVDLSLASGIQNQSHPERLPENIYGTDGDWENYSSPSRDARLKASIREGRSLMQKLIAGYYNKDANVQYNGANILDDLNRVYNQKAKACKLEIKLTNGANRSVDLDTLIENVYALSFDPYHCTELRWGLLDSEALSSCKTSENKMQWYKAQQGLRNRIDRDYSMQMDYSLSELPGANISKVQQEEISIKDVLK